MSPPLRPAIGIAHRGFSPDGAENSMTAFQAAVDLGYRHLETDARVTGDGVALAFHDAILDRVTNSRGQLRQLSWREVSTARILDREPIPRLEEVLSAFGDGVSVNIDVKSDAAVGPTLDAIRRTNAWRRVRLAAFSPARLLQLRRSAGPGTPSALTATEVLALRHGRLRLPGPPARAGLAAQVPPRVGPLAVLQPGFLAAARARGIEVHAWTVNRRAEMIGLLDLGVDAIITDRADLLRDVLRERGQWPT
ncbi:MAG TPA: glycerophosphodiester phosphodiesterase family protein [Jatrophihabitans sp.]|jgi:glycerophosphoryl diester phosphodiesterase|uniref:glycerophosphodiester phosphodiesterase family protein n=1 Tax=Jatrophihabitans sp. TaxID=1932789 RepID=UPI002EE7409C